MTVGERIKGKRKNLRMSQVELAEKSQLTQTTISAIERGVNEPAVSSLSLIAAALGCSVAELVGETEQLVTDGLSAEERKLVADFRRLNRQGQEHVLMTVAMALAACAGEYGHLPIVAAAQ